MSTREKPGGFTQQDVAECAQAHPFQVAFQLRQRAVAVQQGSQAKQGIRGCLPALRQPGAPPKLACQHPALVELIQQAGNLPALQAAGLLEETHQVVAQWEGNVPAPPPECLKIHHRNRQGSVFQVICQCQVAQPFGDALLVILVLVAEPAEVGVPILLFQFKP